MSHSEVQEIAGGTVVEFFEAKQVICGVCTAVKGSRLAVLTEQNKEINLAQSRVVHASAHGLAMTLSRDDLVRRLSDITALRRNLMERVNIEELWSLLESEDEGFEAGDLAELTFSEAVSEDHVAALQRLLFLDRLYFQFKDGRFFPRSEEKVAQRRLELEREEERESQLEEGSRWLQAAWNRKSRPVPPDFQESIVASLKSYCLFGQESPEAPFVKELLKRANVPPQPQSAFRLLVRLGVWHEDENLYLHEQGISADFPPGVVEAAERVAASGLLALSVPEGRKDLRDLHAFTVDSAFTRDYDDALSLRVLEGGLYEVGIHIADAAQFLSRGDLLDQEAQARASSIYLPDGRVSMLPQVLSEGVCSLKAGEDRLAMSFLFRIDASGSVCSQEILLSIVRVSEQMTYEQVNEKVGETDFLRVLHDLALKLRRQRLDRGAIILPLPEIQVYVNDVGMIQVNRYEKETPSQIMVSEWMIAANGLAASYQAERGIPSIFRAQAECRQETDFTQSDHEIFRVYRQRRLFARAEMNIEPGAHCSLALPSYTTVPSPIRRYSDLAVQRQLKHFMATGAILYGKEDLEQLIARLGSVQSKIFQIQRKWTRYWILKYMEQEDYQTINALVLDQTERFAHLLIPELLLETNLPLSDKTRLQAGEMVKVKIERLNPREDLLRLQLAS
jgi:exoribonuclease II